MRFPKFKEFDRKSWEPVRVYGIKVSPYCLGFLETNFDISPEKLKSMDEMTAKSWINKAGWIIELLWSRIYETTPSILIAEEEFGINSYEQFINLTPEEFLGEDGLLQNVNTWIRDNEYDLH